LLGREKTLKQVSLGGRWGGKRRGISKEKVPLGREGNSNEGVVPRKEIWKRVLFHPRKGASIEEE